MIDGLRQDLKHGARMLMRSPGFTLVAMMSIAIGVGANAAMFSLADGLVLRPVQAPRANEIMAVSATAPRGRACSRGTSKARKTSTACASLRGVCSTASNPTPSSCLPAPPSASGRMPGIPSHASTKAS